MNPRPFSLPAVRLHWPQADFEYYYARLLPIGLVAGTALVSVGLAYVMVNLSPAFALLGLLAVPAGIILVVRPDLGLLLVVFAIPMENFNEFGGGLSVLKLLSVVVFGGAIVHFLIFRRNDSLVGAPQNWAIGLFLMAVILSNFVAIDPPVTIDRTFKLLRVLSLYLVVVNVVRTETDLRRLVWVFLISGFVCALYGLYGYYFDRTLLDTEGRVTGTMDDPNEFAAAMTARLPLTLCLLSAEKHRLRKSLLLVGAGIIIWSITLSGSRGGLLALGLSLILFVLLQKNKAAWLAIAGTVVLVVLTAMPLGLKQRVGLVPSNGQGSDSSVERRTTYQVYGIQLFREHPILGVGLDGFAEAYARSEYRFLQAGHVKRIAHNTYLEIVVGTGLVGLVPFVLLLGLSLFTSWKLAGCRARYSYLASVSLGLFAGIAGYSLACFFLSQQYEKTPWLLIAMIVIVLQFVSTADRQSSFLTVVRPRTALHVVSPNAITHCL